eukprot:139802-Hanusia_phi.AAC.5
MQAMSRSIYVLCEEISSLKKTVLSKGGKTNGQQRSNSFSCSDAHENVRNPRTGLRNSHNRDAESEERRREGGRVIIVGTEPVTGLSLLQQTEISSDIRQA